MNVKYYLPYLMMFKYLLLFARNYMSISKCTNPWTVLKCYPICVCIYLCLKVPDGSVCVEAPGGFPFYVVDKDPGDKGTVYKWVNICVY